MFNSYVCLPEVNPIKSHSTTIFLWFSYGFSTTSSFNISKRSVFFPAGQVKHNTEQGSKAVSEHQREILQIILYLTSSCEGKRDLSAYHLSVGWKCWSETKRKKKTLIFYHDNLRPPLIMSHPKIAGWWIFFVYQSCSFGLITMTHDISWHLMTHPHVNHCLNHSESLWIQILSEKVLNPPNYSK